MHYRTKGNVYFDFSAVVVPATNPQEVAFHLVAIVDPVSRGAQKLGPILNVLRQSFNCDIKIFLNCIDKNSDMPLKRYQNNLILILCILLPFHNWISLLFQFLSICFGT